MSLAIKLNNQVGIKAEKVSDEFSDGHLAAEFIIGKSAATELSPENLFGRCWFAPHSTGANQLKLWQLWLSHARLTK